MKMKNQIQIIKDKLEKEGSISNLWALHNFIWRLGARIHDLRLEGWDIETVYVNKKGERNTEYKLISFPQF